MTEKTEWEIIDVPSPQDRQTRQTRQTPRDRMKSLLGPWWRWKVAGVMIAAGLALVMLVALAGMAVIAMTVTALVILGIAKIKRWLRRDNGANNGAASP